MKAFLSLLVLLCSILIVWYYWSHPLTAKVRIRDHTWNLNVAVTPYEKEIGLSGKKSLAQDAAMLFVYDQPGRYSFWMKGMEFPLDFIWIKENTVIDITKNVSIPNGQPLKRYESIEPVDKILEINAGQTDMLGITIGDSVKFFN